MNKKIITVVTAHQLTADTIATAIGATENMTATISATDMP